MTLLRITLWLSSSQNKYFFIDTRNEGPNGRKLEIARLKSVTCHGSQIQIGATPHTARAPQPINVTINCREIRLRGARSYRHRDGPTTPSPPTHRIQFRPYRAPWVQNTANANQNHEGRDRPKSFFIPTTKIGGRNKLAR